MAGAVSGQTAAELAAKDSEASGARQAAPPVRPVDPPAPRAALLAEIEQAQAEVLGDQDGPIDRYERSEYREALARLWTLVERWTVEFLRSHPAADSAAIAADLAELAPKIEGFDPSAVRLGIGSRAVAVVSVEAGFSGGTFFVVSSAQTDRSAAAWSIRPLAERNFALGNELGAWAFLVAGFHDGPLGGRVLPLPAARSGRPRFLIDAITHPSMGLETPGQISVWEWTGSQAVPEFIHNYWTAGANRVERAGDLLRIATKEQPKVFYSCGSCDDPKGTWTLRVTPDGVSDLGHAYEEPLLAAADDLIARLARGEDASSLATPQVIAQLTDLMQGLRQDREETEAHDSQQASEPPGPYDGIASMLESWQVSATGSRHLLDLATDDWHLQLTFEKRGATYYATAVAVL